MVMAKFETLMAFSKISRVDRGSLLDLRTPNTRLLALAMPADVEP